MSQKQITFQQIIKKINLIPQEKRQELYDRIHDFRISLNCQDSKADEIMQFAGNWLDIPEEDFNDFYEEIEQRRQDYSSRRF